MRRVWENFCGKGGKICWQQTLGGRVFAIISNKSSLAGTTVTSVCISAGKI